MGARAAGGGPSQPGRVPSHKRGRLRSWTACRLPGHTAVMANIDVPSPRAWSAGGRDLVRLGRELALGFAYWFMFDIVLEPGNVAQALRTGAPVAWDQEAVRMAGAGLLGAAATPVVLALVRRFPIEGPARWRRAMVHVASSVALSAALIAASCPLAAWALASEHRPLAEALRDQMAANLLHLAFCMAGFVAIAHAVRFSRPSRVAQVEAPAPRTLRRVAVKTRAGLVMVETADIDWIGTQGNYLALHVGPQTHLIRDTSRHFETLLDPERFARAHRQIIVAVDRIQALTPLGNGDAAIRLATGAELRVSRGYRRSLQTRLGAAPSGPGP
jgi:DNA-binding LytR/AlgR family response regulator